MSKLERASYFKDWVDSEKEGDAHNTKHAKSMGGLNQTPVAKGSLKRKLNRKTRVANRMGRYEEEDEDYERSNGPNRPRKRKSEYDEMGKRSKKHTTPTENLKNKKKRDKLGKPVKKPRYDPEVLAEIEGDILDEESYEPSETVRGAQQSVRKAARKRIRQTLPEVYDFVFERGEHEDAGNETVQDAQAFVKRRAQEIYNRRRGIKPKKVKNKMGSNGSAIFSGANTINFTKNGDGTDTVTPMGASAQDIKTAYRKASLNA